MPGVNQEMNWSVTTHDHRERSTDWYWTMGTVALVGVVASVFFGNLLLAVIIVLGVGSIGFLAARGPREHMVRIDARGISIDGTKHPWPSIVSFWVEHDIENPRLFLTLRGVLIPYVSLALDDKAQGNAVREHLKSYVLEEEQGPHIGEHLAEIFGL